MNVLITYIIFLSLVFSNSLFADDSGLVGQIKSISDKLKSDPERVKNFEKFQKALVIQNQLNSDPSYRAKLFYSEGVNNKPCSPCPEYLNLIQSVNSIVEKTKVDSVVADNEKMVQLTKLKFLYYVSRSTNEDDESKCNKYSQMPFGSESKLREGKMKLLTEQALALPNVSEIQMYEGKGKEVRFFYQGEGTESDNIIEVVMNPDGTALVRYYKYESLRSTSLPSLGSDYKKEKDDVDNYAKITPLDSKFGKLGSKTQLTDSLDLRKKTELGITEQTTNISIENTEGKKLLEMSGKNVTDGKKSADAAVSYDFGLDTKSDFKIGTKVGVEFEAKSPKSFSDVERKENFAIGFADKDHEYLSVKTSHDSNGSSGYELGSKYKAGDGHIVSSVNRVKDGTDSYKIGVINQGYLSAAGIKYVNLSEGGREYGASVGTNFGENNVLSTEFTTSSQTGTSYAVNFQKKISENSSFVISVADSQSNGLSTNLIFESKF